MGTVTLDKNHNRFFVQISGIFKWDKNNRKVVINRIPGDPGIKMASPLTGPGIKLCYYTGQFNTIY